MQIRKLKPKQGFAYELLPNILISELCAVEFIGLEPVRRILVRRLLYLLCVYNVCLSLL